MITMSLSHASFGAATALTGYLTYRTMKPPATPRLRDRDTSKVHDSIGSKAFFVFITLYRNLFFAANIWQALYCVRLGTSPIAGSTYRMNHVFFDWSAKSAVLFPILWAAAILRLRAMGELGRDFTFELHEPGKLNTHGLYSYIQHPSYTGGTIVWIGAAVWFFRCDGVMALILPRWIMNTQWIWNKLLPSIVAACVVTGTTYRVKDEEKMLRNKFGKQWESWHRDTPRFLPFIL